MLDIHQCHWGPRTLNQTELTSKLWEYLTTSLFCLDRVMEATKGVTYMDQDSSNVRSRFVWYSWLGREGISFNHSFPWKVMN